MQKSDKQTAEAECLSLPHVDIRDVLKHLHEYETIKEASFIVKGPEVAILTQQTCHINDIITNLSHCNLPSDLRVLVDSRKEAQCEETAAMTQTA